MGTLKVYGINGLLEWHGYVNANGVKMKVDFTNGSVTAFGVAPATFCTKNELTQFVLENSDMYKNGRIRIVQIVEVPEIKGQEARKPMAQTEPVKADEAAVTVAASTEAEVEAPAEAEVKTVEVSCNDDAKDYMVENYGVSRSKMRNRDQIEAVAKENGVVFSWI